MNSNRGDGQGGRGGSPRDAHGDRGGYKGRSDSRERSNGRKDADGRRGGDGGRVYVGNGGRSGGNARASHSGRSSQAPRRLENHASPARIAACLSCRIVRERDAFVSEVVPGVVSRMGPMKPEDVAFATRLARGVVATSGALDDFINRNLYSPADIQPNVRDALRVSAYELLYLKKDDYVAVDQGVELVAYVEPKARALANAVLRKMARTASRWPFGDVGTDVVALSRKVAFPSWMAKRLVEEMGREQAAAFMEASNGDAPVHAAVNAIRATDEEVLAVLQEQGADPNLVEGIPGCIRIGTPKAIRSDVVTKLFEDGKVLISDPSAQKVASFALPGEPPSAFIEVGSGRGTKTVLMQSNAMRKYGKQFPIVSVDDHPFKAKLLRNRAREYGLTSVQTKVADGRKLTSLYEKGSFDAVFVDAPCSGVGTLRRHPEIRWRLTERDVAKMADVQLDILIDAASLVKTGGQVVYSTCTVFREENERVVERFLKTKFGERFEMTEMLKMSLEEDGPDAHFAVRLTKRF
ncbi:RsmB/NOP family class I SAM-dependent RNA methyltransferase [Slackia heliotrinireducens]|uniref:RsmB/NOP family class I SAM-dependent RNA methyltransferase n=1 Tax=Slackia heliotrinireducens TaxID=84110 RepID=UPI003315B7F0